MGGVGDWITYNSLGFSMLITLINCVILFCGALGRAKIFNKLGGTWFQAIIPFENTLTYGKILGRKDLAVMHVVLSIIACVILLVSLFVGSFTFVGEIIGVILSTVSGAFMTLALVAQAALALTLVKKLRLNWTLAFLYGICWDLGDSIVGLSDCTEGLAVVDEKLGLTADLRESLEYVRKHMRGYDGIDKSVFKPNCGNMYSNNNNAEAYGNNEFNRQDTWAAQQRREEQQRYDRQQANRQNDTFDNGLDLDMESQASKQAPRHERRSERRSEMNRNVRKQDSAYREQQQGMARREQPRPNRQAGVNRNTINNGGTNPYDRPVANKLSDDLDFNLNEMDDTNIDF